MTMVSIAIFDIVALLLLIVSILFFFEDSRWFKELEERIGFAADELKLAAKRFYFAEDKYIELNSFLSVLKKEVNDARNEWQNLGRGQMALQKEITDFKTDLTVLNTWHRSTTKEKGQGANALLERAGIK